MIVRDFNELKNTDKCVADARWTSTRLLLADDGMGFSFHITVLEAGSEHTFHYKHHFESVYCMAGKGSITDLATGETHAIRPGVMYALNLHDKHIEELKRSGDYTDYSKNLPVKPKKKNKGKHKNNSKKDR